jgi:hypothetical protein
VCIVTITWACFCIVISLWVICLAFVELLSLGLVEDRDIEVGGFLFITCGRILRIIHE